MTGQHNDTARAVTIYMQQQLAPLVQRIEQLERELQAIKQQEPKRRPLLSLGRKEQAHD